MSRMDQHIAFVWLDVSIFYGATNFVAIVLCGCKAHKFGRPMWLSTQTWTSNMACHRKVVRT